VNDDELRARRRRRPAAASRVMLAAAGVVTLLASGCTTAQAAGTDPATITAKATIAPATAPAPTITVPSPPPASIPAATSTPAATAPPPPPATRAETFSPWAAAGTLAPGIKVLSRYSGGRCTMRSSFDEGNQYAWRCFTASGAFYDPCFAPAAQSGVTQVACSDSPWSGAVIVSLAKPLARSSRGTPGPSAAKYPWAMVLANGQECGLIEGTAPLMDGVTFYFGCTDGYASFPGTRTEPWTVNYAAGSSSPVTSVAVTTAFA
jgi:hypothetical protein